MILRYDNGTNWIQVESEEDMHVRVPKRIAIYSNLKTDKELEPGLSDEEIIQHNATADGMEAALMATMSYSSDLWKQDKFDNICRTLVDALTNNVG